ncbi:MAG: DUF1549 and DUF1553 domain-containing protein [Planctomycetes bacterium]|nr:DUF1549 and DUF1553 domain-containing protein [Planctomycetota bacterium]
MARCLVVAIVLLGLASPSATADDAVPPRRLTPQELADWIDQRFAEEYRRLGAAPAAIVDDATFLRRIYLDLQGRIPTVAQMRDFLADQTSFKRQDYVDRLLANDQPPERFAQRSSEHLGRVWRRMMVPASAPNAAMAPQLDPWLAQQFAENTPYDEFARKLLAAPAAANPQTPAMMGPDAGAAMFQQAVGPQPENLASAYVRVFLGVRIQCAQCHDHPMAAWSQNDFWGMAALLGAGAAAQNSPMPAPTIKPVTEDVAYTAKLLWSEEPLAEIPAGKSPRELLADWLVSPNNPNFAATAVNRTWQYLCGRGLVGSVDDLDQVSDEERKILDDLAKLFVDSGYDVAWLITGICKSKVYQQAAAGEPGGYGEGFVHRPLKTLLPEQVFDSLEQALNLPVARIDNGPRFNGERDQFVARMNESAAETPSDYKGGIPQALMLMNGKLTADATSLDNSRTLRAVIEAPFLADEEKIETLYMASLTRRPSEEEMAFLLEHVQSKKAPQERKQAYAEIFWGLLNSPEFVLSR